jgi:hypothetical protein
MSKEILYDLHSRDEIEFYYFLDSRVGKDTCQARCAHCYFIHKGRQASKRGPNPA